MITERIAPFDTYTEDENAEEHIQVQSKKIHASDEKNVDDGDIKIRRKHRYSKAKFVDGASTENIKKILRKKNRRRRSSEMRKNENKYSRNERSVMHPMPFVKEENILGYSTDTAPDENSNRIRKKKKKPSRISRRYKVIDAEVETPIIPEYVKVLLDTNPKPKIKPPVLKNESFGQIENLGIRLSPLDSNLELRNRNRSVVLQIESTQTDDCFESSVPDESEGPIQVIRFMLAMVLLITFTYLGFSSGPSLISFHVLFMAICWVYLMTFGLNAFHQDNFMILSINDDRKNQHWIMMLMGFICVLIGLIIIFIFKSINNRGHLNSFHDVLGLVAFVIFSINLIGGLIIYKFVNYDKRLFKSFHAVFGLSTYIIGTITIIIKFFDEWWDGGLVSLYIIISVILFNMILAMYKPKKSLILKLKRQKFKQNIN